MLVKLPDDSLNTLEIILKYLSKIEWYPINEKFNYSKENNNKYISLTIFYYFTIIAYNAYIVLLTKYWREEQLLNFDVNWLSYLTIAFYVCLALPPFVNFFKTSDLVRILILLNKINLKINNGIKFNKNKRILIILSIQIVILIKSIIDQTEKYHSENMTYFLNFFMFIRNYIYYEMIVLIGETQICHLNAMNRCKSDVVSVVRCLADSSRISNGVSTHLGLLVLNNFIFSSVSLFMKFYVFYLYGGDGLYGDMVLYVITGFVFTCYLALKMTYVSVELHETVGN